MRKKKVKSDFVIGARLFMLSLLVAAAAITISGAAKAATVSHTPSEIMPQGAGSGIDADTVDGLNAADLLASAYWKESGSKIYYNDGNVGIGTADPANRLEVKASGTTAIRGSADDPANTGNGVGVVGYSAEGIFGRGVLGWRDGGAGYGVQGLSFNGGSGFAGSFSALGSSTNALQAIGRVAISPPGGGGWSPTNLVHIKDGNLKVEDGYLFADNDNSFGVKGKSSAGWGVIGETSSDGWYGGVYAKNTRTDSAGYGLYATIDGTQSNDWAIYCNAPGNALCGGTKGWSISSSARWKEDVETIDGALEKVMALRGVYFNWKDWEFGNPEKRQVGMIAEEVGKVMPEIVAFEEDGLHATTMQYSLLTPLLVEAVKEQQKEMRRVSDNIRIKEEGQLEVRALNAEELEVGSPQKRTGITIYDEDSGKAYCVKIKSGELLHTLGTCRE